MIYNNLQATCSDSDVWVIHDNSWAILIDL